MNAPVARRTQGAYWCNVVGTVLLGASVFIDHPLVFMIVIALGVPLLLVGFALWVWRVAEMSLGSPPQRPPSG
jgi:hypothetical protein